MDMHDLYERLKARYPLGELTLQRPDLAFATVPADHARDLLRALRDQEGFSHLVLLTAVDWLEDGLFQLTYLLNDRARARDFGVRVMIPRPERGLAGMESIHDLWPTAATYQRELREMFGIDFPGSPRLEEPFILEGWHDIPPYRRDFDTLRYAREHYAERPGRATSDPETHMREALYPGQHPAGK